MRERSYPDTESLAGLTPQASTKPARSTPQPATAAMGPCSLSRPWPARSRAALPIRSTLAIRSTTGLLAAVCGSLFNFVDFLINQPLMPMLLGFVVLVIECT